MFIKYLSFRSKNTSIKRLQRNIQCDLEEIEALQAEYGQEYGYDTAGRIWSSAVIPVQTINSFHKTKLR